MEQMTAAYNNELLCSLSWQTRLVRERTWNNVSLKPGSILCKVSGTKSSYVLCSEMWTHLLLTVFTMDLPSSPKQSTMGPSYRWGKITNFSGKRKICLNIKASQIQVASKYIQHLWLPWNDNIQSAVSLTCGCGLCWPFQMFFLLFTKSAEGETLSSNVTLW